MTASPLAADPEVRRRPLTRALYDALVAQGAFHGEPIELLEGELVTMAPQGEPHASTVDILARRLDRLLLAAYDEAYAVRQEKPFVASDLSEPEPDIAVIDAAAATFAAAHPSWAHLIVEVAESSAGVDLRHKPRIYAGSAVPLYWVIDLARRRTVVHSDPHPGADAHYGEVLIRSFGDDLAVLGVSLRLADLLS